MAENSAIEWTTHTFNPWAGCEKVSPACDNCYAERWAKRAGRPELWNGERQRTRPANWDKPRKWNAAAEGAEQRPRVFTASLADVFDDQVPREWRDDLFALIRETPNLDWLILTKRPENMAGMLPADWGDGYANVWLGVTAENQEEADKRVPILQQTPSKIRYLSCEPLLGPIDMERGGFTFLRDLKSPTGKKYGRIHWVITGGESGPGYRHAEPDWFRGIRDQCAANGTAFLFKQWEGSTPRTVKARGRELDDVIHDGYPLDAIAKARGAA